jgi:putative membrane protein
MSLDTLLLLGYAVLGALVASLLACVPALHIYNVAGLVILAGARLAGVIPSGEALAMFLLGMVTGYATLNTVPSIFFSAPDDSTAFVVLPGQKYLMQGRGYEAAVLTGAGGLGGLLIVVAFSPLASSVLPALRAIVSPHLGWILAAVTGFMLMSEWPKSGDRAKTPLGRLAEAWSGLGAGLLTFVLSGLLGFVLTYRSIVPSEVAFQNLLPAFVGLFAIPGVIQNIIARTRVPEQHIGASLDITPSLLARGVLAGLLGGSFAAFFPVVTGGIGGLLAGHATAQRDDRLFILSQGASKVVYYVGGFLLFFVPGLGLARGGMAWMLSTVYAPGAPQIYFTAVAAVACAGAASFLLLLWFSRAAIALIGRVDYQRLSAATLVLLVTLVLALTGWGGLLVALAATGIGLIPVTFGCRKVNCMGVLLLPITLNMAGVGVGIAHWLGLI